MNNSDFIKLAKKKQMQTNEPVRLGISIHKVIHRWNGNDTRYFRLYLDDVEVTKNVAEILNYPLSKSSSSKLYGCVLVHGSNMDMAFALCNSFRAKTLHEYGDLFDNDYIYRGFNSWTK